MNRQQFLISTISKKGQTTIPASIRKLLKLAPGDALKYEIEKGETVRIGKAA
ncbi:MAG: type II toxin-antitoxin system PrlF family antitoxin, partial [Spirochaetota bacterium]